MGTMFSITAYGATVCHVEEVVSQAFEEIDRLEKRLSHYRPESEVCVVNREAFGRDVAVTPELFDLLQESIQLSEETAGAFDITVGRLMKSWGFYQGVECIPSQPELLHLVKQTGYRHVKLDRAGRSIRFDQPGVELDLGAIGKGYAVDRVVELLRAGEIDSALVSGGRSSIYALGAPPGQTAWEISICHPLDRRRQVCRLRLRDLSVSISGISEKAYALDGRLYSHILDPAKGEPTDKLMLSIVVATSTTQSDGLSTSFFVGGAALGRSYLASHPGVAAVLYRRDGCSQSLQEIVLRSQFNHPAQERFTHSPGYEDFKTD
jgi:thiamine biosynthesis lipoprotein